MKRISILCDPTGDIAGGLSVNRTRKQGNTIYKILGRKEKKPTVY
jgi:hypothetical protein